ncbi:unnamed protein product [Rhizoctonia solani]|uniref:HAT C-terminal dimerisation domain-containing protein n=1 Tax=Rhizoctonia solani TaxID=456999 RepID=A0A8H2Y1Q8_9AGAM|nr:unnamed protein product [Rhizoctonia solani]CAE6440189.1 unnamed protein product [Rhizoctonia solani]
MADYRDKCHEEGVTIPGVSYELSRLADSGPAYSNRGLEEHIAQWTAVDDQAMSVVDRKEFRRTILFASQAPQPLCESDIPHRTKLTKVSSELYREEMTRIKQELAKTLGRVSVTSDLWSDDQLHSFMAVTLHYINSLGDLAEHLYAFRRVRGSHTGVNVGRILFGILEDADLVGKIGHVTLDNASNNDTLMAELEVAFNDKHSPFEKKLNRVRCFPHVINLVVQAIINALPAAARDFQATVERCGDKLGDMDSELIEYLMALESNPVQVCRDSVRAMRSSDSRREGLHDTIEDGNTCELFKTSYGEVVSVALLELLCDCKTRWSSTYDMITRYLELYPAVALYACRNPRMSIPIVTHKQFEVLQDIRSVLSILHEAQELLSAEKTPTLALALPVYETLLEALDDCVDKFPELRYAIERGIDKLSDYVSKARNLPVYTLAMAINPTLKFKWTDQSDDPGRRHWARLTIREAMLGVCQKQHQCTTSTTPHSNTPAEHASQAQAHGFKRLLTVSSTVNRASRSLPSSRTATQPNTPKPAAPMSKDKLLTLHMTKVDAELLRWEKYEWVGNDTMGTIDIVEFWKAHRRVFPLLYQVAMDILPVQASSVSSERAFSSAKLTCTREQNRISVEHMEELQVLKHSLHQRRADNTSHQTLDFMANVVDPDWNKSDFSDSE